MKHQNHILLLSTSLLYFLGQLATGTDVYVAFLFSAAIVFGLYSVWAAGGLLTAFGALNAILIAKFLLIGIALKIVMFDPADRNLLAAESTAAVMAIGFMGLLIGTAVQRRLPTPRTPFIPEVGGASMYLALTIVFLIFGYGGYLVGLGPDLAGEGTQTGGVLGIARVLAGLKAFAIVPALFFAWVRKGSRFMTHPLPLTVLIIGVVAGIFTTSKLEAMESLVFWILVGSLRYGLRDKRIVALGAMGILYYAALVYPYSQYVRSHGGREGNISERVQAMKDVFWTAATNSDFRHSVLAKDDDPNASYFLGNETLKPFGRLAMVGQADRLVAATIDRQSNTGWYTVNQGLELATPSFIYPDKPIYGTGNYLGHITGEVGSRDRVTQVSYGVMATFFNAFSYSGVFLGSIAFFCSFYYILRLFFGNPRGGVSPSASTLWFFFLVATFQHSLVEETVTGLIAAWRVPVIVLAMCIAAKLICPLLPKYAFVQVPD
jgi:hypothetical protein